MVKDKSVVTIYNDMPEDYIPSQFFRIYKPMIVKFVGKFFWRITW